jgi:hypothetical protein
MVTARAFIHVLAVHPHFQPTIKESQSVETLSISSTGKTTILDNTAHHNNEGM